MKYLNQNVRRLTVSQGGFTLMELMVALFLTIFLMGGVMAVYQSGKISFLDSNQLSRIQESVRFASDYMIRDIRNAGFRDETYLRYGHEQQITGNFAEGAFGGYAEIIDNGDGTQALRIRYAGRGSCTEAFDEFRLVENEYSVSADGELVCRGRSLPRDNAGTDQISDPVVAPWQDPIPLVTGVTGIAFRPICPSVRSNNCDETATSIVCWVDTDDPDTLTDTPCMGVRIALEFEGLRELGGDQDFEPRSVELTASFRNIVLDRMNADAWGTGTVASEAGGEQGI